MVGILRTIVKTGVDMLQFIYNFLKNDTHFTLADEEIKRETTTIILVILVCIGLMTLLGPSENIIPVGLVLYILLRYLQRGAE